MKIKGLLAGLVLVLASLGSAYASTIFQPTDQNVNFIPLVVTGPTAGLQLAMFDDIGPLSGPSWLSIDYTGDVVDFLPNPIGQNVSYTVNNNAYDTNPSGVNNTLTLTGNDNFRLALRRGVPSDPDFIAWSEPNAVACNGASQTCTLTWVMGLTELAIDLKISEAVPPAEVPVPAAAWLFGSGLLGLFGVARRKKLIV